MNKNDLISAVADASGLSKNDAANAVEGVFDAITKALSGGDEVRLVGFGTFSVAKRKASTGRNPRTGDPTEDVLGRASPTEAEQAPVGEICPSRYGE